MATLILVGLPAPHNLELLMLAGGAVQGPPSERRLIKKLEFPYQSLGASGCSWVISAQRSIIEQRWPRLRWSELQELVELTSIPFYTTPQGRGVVPDDHKYSYLTMRLSAFRDADLIISSAPA